MGTIAEGHADLGRVEAELRAVGISGPALNAIMSVIRVHARPGAHHIEPASPSPATVGDLASFYLRKSLSRKNFIGNQADDPSWNMLLALFADERRDVPTSITSACVASGAPPTTALRRLEQMREQGVLRRRSDPFDARRSYLELTEEASRRMEKLIVSFTVDGSQIEGTKPSGRSHA